MSVGWKPPAKKQEEQRSAIVDGMVKLLASFFYVGYLPVLPGTAAALLGVAIYRYAIATQPIRAEGLFVVYLVTFLMGVWACAEGRKVYNAGEWSIIVIDKALGAMIAVSGFAAGVFDEAMGRVVVAFAFVRLFEILKLFPLKYLEKLPSGWGAMADDVGAGVITLAVMVFLPASAWDLIGLPMQTRPR